MTNNLKGLKILKTKNYKCLSDKSETGFTKNKIYSCIQDNYLINDEGTPIRILPLEFMYFKRQLSTIEKITPFLFTVLLNIIIYWLLAFIAYDINFLKGLTTCIKESMLCRISLLLYAFANVYSLINIYELLVINKIKHEEKDI